MRKLAFASFAVLALSWTTIPALAGQDVYFVPSMNLGGAEARKIAANETTTFSYTVRFDKGSALSTICNATINGDAAALDCGNGDDIGRVVELKLTDGTVVRATQWHTGAIEESEAIRLIESARQKRPLGLQKTEADRLHERSRAQLLTAIRELWLK